MAKRASSRATSASSANLRVSAFNTLVLACRWQRHGPRRQRSAGAGAGRAGRRQHEEAVPADHGETPAVPADHEEMGSSSSVEAETAYREGALHADVDELVEAAGPEQRGI